MSLGVGAISKWDILYFILMENGANRSTSTVSVCSSLCEGGVQCNKSRIAIKDCSWSLMKINGKTIIINCSINASQLRNHNQACHWAFQHSFIGCVSCIHEKNPYEHIVNLSVLAKAREVYFS